jgi:hypothetical protein
MKLTNVQNQRGNSWVPAQSIIITAMTPAYEIYSWEEEGQNCNARSKITRPAIIPLEEFPPLTRYGKRLTPGTPEWFYFMVNVIIGDGANRTEWGYRQEGEWSAEILHGSGNYIRMMILHHINCNLDYK